MVFDISYSIPNEEKSVVKQKTKMKTVSCKNLADLGEKLAAVKIKEEDILMITRIY